MYNLVYSGFGITDPTVRSRVIASMPRCMNPAFQDCELHPDISSYPNCKEIMSVRENDPETYNAIYDTVPYCDDPSEVSLKSLISHPIPILIGIGIGAIITKLVL